MNRTRWSDEAVVEQYSADGGGRMDIWSDPGEQAAVAAVASRVRGVPILDLGVGGGRTTSLLRLLSDDYVGVDYTPAMVDAARLNHPDVDLRLADARDLSGLPRAAFGLVVFSYNGLDAIDHDGRQLALAEMAAALRPGGVLLYSTHNRSGPCFRATALHPAGSPVAHTWSRGYRLGFTAVGALTAPVRLPRAVRNRRRLQPSVRDHGSWAVAPNEAHDFGLLLHYVTLAGVRAELDAVGLVLEAVFDAERGAPLALDSDPTHARYFHVVAAKPAS
ncbi:class I SAM-dependent methyltransferase [Jatrophihabitans sp.]|uniref:class I SAM-dependent methyltransferase n=1 Tax=Jatrophihabitans sp. TaxID=1932789 RepID=UPI0030C7128E